MFIRHYIHIHIHTSLCILYAYIFTHVCTLIKLNTKFSQPWQTIILSNSCRPDLSTLPFFLFLLLYFLPFDVYLGIHLSAYPYIDVSIYLFYLLDLLSLSVRSPLEFTGTFIYFFVSILELWFLGYYSLSTYYFYTDNLQRYNLSVKSFLQVVLCLNMLM